MKLILQKSFKIGFCKQLIIDTRTFCISNEKHMIKKGIINSTPHSVFPTNS